MYEELTSKEINNLLLFSFCATLTYGFQNLFVDQVQEITFGLNLDWNGYSMYYLKYEKCLYFLLQSENKKITAHLYVKYIEIIT